MEQAEHTLETMQVKNGETVNRISTVNAEDETVRLFNVSKNEKTGQNYKVDWTFDFTSCSEAEVLELAARSAVIAYRKNFRSVDAESIPTFANRVVNVKDDIITSRVSKKDPMKQAKSLLQGLSEEQRADLLKELGL